MITCNNLHETMKNTASTGTAMAAPFDTEEEKMNQRTHYL